MVINISMVASISTYFPFILTNRVLIEVNTDKSMPYM
jgi:hypothetical protein